MLTDDYNKESVKLIAGIVDMDKDGFISFSEFQAFEGLLCVPDALYKTAFQLFDTNGNGLVAFGKGIIVCKFPSRVVSKPITDLTSNRNVWLLMDNNI